MGEFIGGRRYKGWTWHSGPRPRPAELLEPLEALFDLAPFLFCQSEDVVDGFV